MIVYRCDISGRELTLEQVERCGQVKTEYQQEQNLPPMLFSFICGNDFLFHPDYESVIAQYWEDKKKIVEELMANWENRVKNHKKAFFKGYRQLKVV